MGAVFLDVRFSMIEFVLDEGILLKWEKNALYSVQFHDFRQMRTFTHDQISRTSYDVRLNTRDDLEIVRSRCGYLRCNRSFLQPSTADMTHEMHEPQAAAHLEMLYLSHFPSYDTRYVQGVSRASATTAPPTCVALRHPLFSHWGFSRSTILSYSRQ